VITAVCVVAVPDGEHKKIAEFGHFMTAAAWALWSQAWLLIVYKYWTPDEITAVEAWFTLLMMPLLLGTVYWVDVKFSQPEAPAPDGEEGLAQVS
jgi:solute carrier family 8 (sodium/calcium exchanger)